MYSYPEEEKNLYRFIILTIVTLVRTCIGFIWASAGPLLPLIMTAYGINRGTVGWFASSAPLTVVILAMPIGIIGARFSLKKTFALGAFLQAAGILAPLCGSYLPLLLTRVFFAIGTAITVPLATVIAAEWFSNRELPLINGITICFVNLGNAIAYVATVPLASAISWKAPISIYGALAFTCATAWVILGKDRIKKVKEVPATPVLDNIPALSVPQLLTNRSTMLLAFAVMGSWCLGNAIGSWLPAYYNEVFKMPLEKASSITAIINVVGTITSIVGGMLPMRLGRRKPFLIIPGVLMGVSALSCILFNNPAVIYTSIAFLGLFSNLQNPSLFTIPLELPDMSLRDGAIVISIMLVGGNLGNFIGPLFVGYLTDLTGSYLPGFLVCAVMSLSLLVAGLLLPETGPGAGTTKTRKATE